MVKVVKRRKSHKPKWLETLGVLWMRTPIGGLLHMGVVKLSPIHRQLQALEVQNIMAYYNEWNRPRRWPIFRFYAWLWSYFISGFRLWGLSASARQDYYALNRQSPYASKVIPLISDLLHETDKLIRPTVRTEGYASLQSDEEALRLAQERLPILVVPGLNTPPYFFREMVEHFKVQGYPIYVAEMPKNGLASVGEAAVAVHEQIDALCHHYQVDRIHVVGHCLGGLVVKYLIDTMWTLTPKSPIKTLVTLGTGFLGATGVQRLKEYWVPRNLDKPIPEVFDQLTKAQQALVQHGADVVYHSIVTVWDFMVPFQNALLQTVPVAAPLLVPVGGGARNLAPLGPKVYNHLLEDWKLDHLTLALNRKALQKIQECLEPEPPA
jgi:pimeloyl-ACP methyl ester carboxylesterase